MELSRDQSIRMDQTLKILEQTMDIDGSDSEGDELIRQIPLDDDELIDEIDREVK